MTMTWNNGTVPELRARMCRNCGGVTRDEPAAGWYGLTVMVPTDISPRKYRWVGLFCSPECLAAFMPEVAIAADLHAGLYERSQPVKAKSFCQTG